MGKHLPENRDPTYNDKSCKRQHEASDELRRIQLVELRLLKAFDRMCQANNITYWIDGGTLLGAVRHGGFIPWDDDVDICMPRADLERFVALAQRELPNGLEVDTATATRDADYNVPCRIRDCSSRIVDTVSPVHLQRGLFLDIVPVDSFHARGPWRQAEVIMKLLYRNLIKLHQLPQQKTWSNMPFFLLHRLLRLCQPVVTPESPVKMYRALLRKFVITRISNNEDDRDVGYGFDVRWTRIFKRSDIFPIRRLRFEDTEVCAPHNPDGVLRVFYGDDYMVPPPSGQRPPSHFSKVVFDVYSKREFRNCDNTKKGSHIHD